MYQKRNTRPSKLKECPHCKREYPKLWKQFTINDKRVTLCQNCSAKHQEKKKKDADARRRRNKLLAKRESVSYLTKKLDQVFSKYIRLRDANKDGFIRCIDCGEVAHWRDVDCGHFMPRRFMNTRWHEQNCAAQLKACNGPIGLGRQYEFGKGLDIRYGPGTADKMTVLCKEQKKWTSAELKEMIDYYTEKLDRLSNQNNNTL